MLTLARPVIDGGFAMCARSAEIARFGRTPMPYPSRDHLAPRLPAPLACLSSLLARRHRRNQSRRQGVVGGGVRALERGEDRVGPREGAGGHWKSHCALSGRLCTL